jgi:hypothetical protein
MEAKMLNRYQKLAMLVTITLCMVLATSAIAEDKLSGSIDISSKTVAIGIGVSWGNGTLTFQGKSYKFKVEGLSVVDLGISSVSAAGEVYNLFSLSDFEGTYSGGGAGIAVAGGAGAQSLTNQNGVKIKLKSKQQGIQLKLAPEGLKIKMAE